MRRLSRLISIPNYTRPWIYRNRVDEIPTSASRRYSRHSADLRIYNNKSGGRSVTLVIASCLGVGSVFVLSDKAPNSVNHFLEATARTGRVLLTLGACINE